MNHSFFQFSQQTQNTEKSHIWLSLKQSEIFFPPLFPASATPKINIELNKLVLN